MTFLHFLMLDKRVEHGPTKNQHIAEPPHNRFHLIKVHHSDDRLRTRLSRATDVMGKGARYLDLQASYVTNSDTENATQGHHYPEVARAEQREVPNRAELAKEKDKRREEEQGVEIIVELQEPDVAVNYWHHALRVNSIKTNKQRT